jgi:hypothetical protein
MQDKMAYSDEDYKKDLIMAESAGNPVIIPQTQPAQEMQIEQKEGIKLIKNSKGYNWEIKILSLDIDQLENLNKEMEKRFGTEPKY